MDTVRDPLEPPSGHPRVHCAPPTPTMQHAWFCASLLARRAQIIEREMHRNPAAFAQAGGPCTSAVVAWGGGGGALLCPRECGAWRVQALLCRYVSSQCVGACMHEGRVAYTSKHAGLRLHLHFRCMCLWCLVAGLGAQSRAQRVQYRIVGEGAERVAYALRWRGAVAVASAFEGGRSMLCAARAGEVCGALPTASVLGFGSERRWAPRPDFAEEARVQDLWSEGARLRQGPWHAHPVPGLP